MQRNTWHDLETFSARPLTSGTHQYAEVAEVMLWSFADGDGHVHVWDRVHGDVWHQDPITEQWQKLPFEPNADPAPTELQWIIDDEDALIWFHNGGMFDMVVLQLAMPEVYAAIRFDRWRDTMVQALAHGCPGALEKLGVVLQLNQEDKKHTAEGRRLVRLFCLPQKDGTRATRGTHPADWQKFIEYAGQDIVTMREVHRKLPKWNYGGDSAVAKRELRIWQADLKVNCRGMLMDSELARNAVRAVQREKERLASESNRMTLGNVPSTTQRDVVLEYLLSEYGVTLPDMQADTLERRLKDDTLPDAVRELIALRLQASQNAASKYKTLLTALSLDRRLRGTKQYCGALRTGRWAGRLMQMDNMPRPNIKAIAQWFGIPKAKVKSHHIKEFVDAGIAALKAGAEDLVFDDIMAVSGTVVRGTIVAPAGMRLDVADLANIEGRVAAWLAGEEWKLQAFLDYDTILGLDEEGEPIRKGPDLYRKSYAKSFNISIDAVTKENRQVGKVQELMLQYAGGVGAFITGAATYELDLSELAEAAWPVLPPGVIAEAQNFLNWLYEGPERQAAEEIRKIDALCDQTLHEDPELEDKAVQVREADIAKAVQRRDAARLKARLGLPEKTFLVCDSLKRLWRAAHPAISSYWKGDFDNPGVEDSAFNAIECPGTTFTARKLRFRRDGKWLRIILPSGRALCYLDPKIEKGVITFMGLSQYTRQWRRVSTYGGKLFENVCQAAARDQLAEGLLLAEEHGYNPILHIHDEIICEVEDNDLYSQQELAEMMCVRRKWNEGLPLAAAGFSCKRYRKE